MSINKIFNSVETPGKLQDTIIELIKTKVPINDDLSGLDSSVLIEAKTNRFYVISELTQNIEFSLPDPALGGQISVKLKLDDLQGKSVNLIPSVGTIEGQVSYVLNVPRLSIQLRSDDVSEWMII